MKAIGRSKQQHLSAASKVMHRNRWTICPVYLHLQDLPQTCKAHMT